MRAKLVLHRRGWTVVIAALSLVTMGGVVAVVAPASSGAASTPKANGELDCNGDSPVQHPVRSSMACTDIRGFAGVDNANTWGGRFYDNGHYIGHDEPDMTFYSKAAGSGNDVTWNETLGKDPAAAPTVKTPGADVSHFYQLSVAPWFSMAMCDGNSYPQLPCTPLSDANAPSKNYQGGGSAFMEMQFYPPGFAPFDDSVSCDNTHWCAALNIDSLECTFGFASCNTNCEEPVNFAFIQTDGVPAGPPSPQLADLATFTPNGNTLLMNPGDRVSVHMSDAPLPGGGGSAFEVVLDDHSTGQSGFMQASAANGFQNTSMADCSGTPFNFQPEYSTAAKSNFIPWAALQTNISTEFEIGHFTPCTSLAKPASLALAPGISDTYWNVCHGPYETAAKGGDGKGQAETTDAECYPAGDTHGALNAAPNMSTGCLDFFAGGDLDFDGSPYWQEWPTGSAPTATYPASFVQSLPTTAGTQYSQFLLQTDVALSESTCSGTSTVGCAVPPPSAPGHFYPYWSRADHQGTCTIEFGNVSAGVNDFGATTQYGSDQIATLGYPEFEGPVQSNACR